MSNCADCAKKLSPKAKLGRCRICFIHHINAVDPAVKKRRVQARLRRSWCPAPYRAEYQHLRRWKRMGAVEARRIILEQIANDTKGLDPLAAAIISRGLAA